MMDHVTEMLASLPEVENPDEENGDHEDDSDPDDGEEEEMDTQWKKFIFILINTSWDLEDT